MRKVTFWLCFILAIFLPTANKANGLNPAPFSKLSHAEVTVKDYQSVCDSILFTDLMEDESDDECQESERKKNTNGKSLLHYTTSFKLNSPRGSPGRASNSGLFFISDTFRYIYFSVFRL